MEVTEEEGVKEGAEGEVRARRNKLNTDSLQLLSCSFERTLSTTVSSTTTMFLRNRYRN